jgi:hypothetical protein
MAVYAFAPEQHIVQSTFLEHESEPVSPCCSKLSDGFMLKLHIEAQAIPGLMEIL